MSSLFTLIFEDIIIFGIAVILVALTATYAAASASHITDIKDWEKNAKLASAHHYLSIAASVGWIYIGLMAGLIILLIVFALTGLVDFGLSDVIEANLLPAIFGLTNFITVIILLSVGVLSAIGLYNINTSNVDGIDVAKNKALVATLVSLGAFAIILIYYVVSYLIGKTGNEDTQEEE